MSDTPDASFRLLDDDHRIAVSLDCANCGYDLRGRRIDECCSECGDAVEPSTQFAPLRIGKPEVVRRIRAAARSLFVTCLLGAIWPWTLVIPVAGPIFVVFAIPIATCQLTLVALRMSHRDSAARVLAVGSLLFQATLFVGALSLISGRVVSWQTPVLLVATWLLLYLASHYFAISALAGILVRVRVRIAPDEPAFGNLQRISAGLAIAWLVIALAGLAVAASADLDSPAFEVLPGIVAVVATTVALMQWCFTIMVLPDCVVLRNILREPPPAAWFSGQVNEG